MPTHSGPNTYGEENLVFAFDTGDTINSYKGRPTTNRLSQKGVDGFNLSGYNTWAGGSSSHITYDSTVVTPYGNTGATKIEAISGSANYSLYTKESWSEGGEIDYTIQALVKPIQLSNEVVFGLLNDNTNKVSFDLASKTVTYGSNISNRNAKLRYVEDGWYYLEANVEGRSGGWVPSFGIADQQGYPRSWTPSTDQSIYIAAVQIEHSQAVASPFVNGTRSSTQGLIDLTGNSTLDLSNVSFDSNAQIDFDGTDDRVTDIGPVHSRLSSSATETVFKAESLPSKGFAMVFGYKHVGGNYSQFTTGPIGLKSDGQIYSSVITTTEVYRPVYSSTITLGKYYHVVVNKDTVTGKLELYINGELVSSNTFDTETYSQWPTTGNYIGTDYLEIGGLTNSSPVVWTRYLDGSVPVGKLYSRTLTASEIKSNFNAQKSRFNL